MDALLSFLAERPLLTGAALLLAAAIALVEIKRLFRPWRTVGPFELTALVNGGALLIDLRGDKAHREGHIAGARRGESADPAAALKGVGPDDAVVLYCETGADSDKAAAKLAAAGHRKLAILGGGISAWRAENLPLAKG